MFKKKKKEKKKCIFFLTHGWQVLLHLRQRLISSQEFSAGSHCPRVILYRVRLDADSQSLVVFGDPTAAGKQPGSPGDSSLLLKY